MLNLLKNLLGMGPKVDLKELMKNGAQIIDVRTPSEFAGGHLKGAINLPLQTLGNNLSKIKKDKPVITCCASGMRSSAAKRLLKSNGFDAHNGGAWQKLKNS